MPKLLRSGLALLALSISLGSCGSSSSPADKCYALVDKVCVRAVACFNDGTTQAACVTEGRSQLDCAAAVGVSASYGSCVSALDTITCADLTAGGDLNLPAACAGVILLP